MADGGGGRASGAAATVTPGGSAADGGDTAMCLIVRVKQHGVALRVSEVRELTPVPKVVGLPGADACVRGLINVRGEIITLVDLRSKLGLPTLAQDAEAMVKVLAEREQDHKNWLAELDASVREKRAFGLTRDPHKCKFGKWYDTYKPDIGALAFLWDAFDAPHKRIHALADEVAKHVSSRDWEAALACVRGGNETDMRALTRLFGDAARALSRGGRELAVILHHGARTLAISADLAEAVEAVPPERAGTVSDFTLGRGSELVKEIVHRAEDGELLLVLDVERLFPAPASAAVA